MEVLLVDDQAVTVQVFAAAVRRTFAGARVHTAVALSEALQIPAGRPLELVLGQVRQEYGRATRLAAGGTRPRRVLRQLAENLLRLARAKAQAQRLQNTNSVRQTCSRCRSRTGTSMRWSACSAFSSCPTWRRQCGRSGGYCDPGASLRSPPGDRVSSSRRTPPSGMRSARCGPISTRA